MAVRALSDLRTDGVRLGRSAADLVGFHGATPTAQGTIATLTSGTLGDVNSKVNALADFLRTKGLLA